MLYVVNPNSSRLVTDDIAQSVALLDGLGVEIACETLSEGPPGIESESQAQAVVAPLLTRCAALEAQAEGFVIACFGDPGLWALRAQTPKPVFGIQEAAVLQAMTLGQRFGVISILTASIPRHHRAFAAMGVSTRVAGDRALELGVADLADEDRTLSRLIEVGHALRDVDGAESLILGCAGMARYKSDVESACALPVIEPCQAAVAMAIPRILMERNR